MRRPEYCLCFTGEDGTEDLFWFSHERRATENAAREKFQHHAALIPPEIGLRLNRTGVPGEGRQLLTEKLPAQQPAAPTGQTV